MTKPNVEDEGECKAKELVPWFSRGCVLNHENHVGIWPFCDHRPFISDTRGSLFTLEPGWTMIGWCQAPFKSSRNYNDALVLEFDPSASSQNDSMWGGREAGVYWIHCKLEELTFKKNSIEPKR